MISAPDFDKDYILYLSSSEVLVVGVLFQIGDDGKEPIVPLGSAFLKNPFFHGLP